MQPPAKKLLDQVREAIRVKHHSYRTEETYVQWIRRYVLFHNKQHPKDMSSPEVEAFLTHLPPKSMLLHPPRTKPYALCCFYTKMFYINRCLNQLMPFVRRDLIICPQF